MRVLPRAAHSGDVVAFDVTPIIAALGYPLVDVAWIDERMAPIDGIDFTRQPRAGRLRPGPYLSG